MNACTVVPLILALLSLHLTSAIEVHDVLDEQETADARPIEASITDPTIASFQAAFSAAHEKEESQDSAVEGETDDDWSPNEDDDNGTSEDDDDDDDDTMYEAEPTVSPTASRSPTRAPWSRQRPPTRNPTSKPTRAPTPSPTKRPTRDPTRSPTKRPTRDPTRRPSRRTREPTQSPTKRPTRDPTRSPTPRPTRRPTTGTDLLRSLAPGVAPSCASCDHKPEQMRAVPLASNWQSLVAGETTISKLDYDGLFQLWLDCPRRSAVFFTYTAVKDCGCFARAHSFYIDHNRTRVPRHCQQYSGSSYGSKYDRGHLVPANHLDFSEQAIRDSNYMTNISPQAKQLNRGAWLQVEEIIECHRDIEPLTIVGGVVWHETMRINETLLWESHGVQLPTAFWKVVRAKTLYPEDNGLIAWWFPNIDTATRKQLDQYLVSIDELEANIAAHSTVSSPGASGNGFKSTPIKFELSPELKAHRPAKSWALPKGCDKSR